MGRLTFILALFCTSAEIRIPRTLIRLLVQWGEDRSQLLMPVDHFDSIRSSCVCGRSRRMQGFSIISCAAGIGLGSDYLAPCRCPAINEVRDQYLDFNQILTVHTHIHTHICEYRDDRKMKDFDSDFNTRLYFQVKYEDVLDA